MIIIGKFKESYNDNLLPSINDLIQEKPIDEKNKVLQYLKNNRKGACAPGNMNDVITGETIPGEMCCYTDGKYGWRSDTIYYFEKYNLKLDEEFIKQILN